MALWSPRRWNCDGAFSSRRLRSAPQIYPHALGRRTHFTARNGSPCCSAISPPLSEQRRRAARKCRFQRCLARHHRTRDHTCSARRAAPGLQEATNPDVLAFHEAFADIVALFQHFTIPEALRSEIAKTRGRFAAREPSGEASRSVWLRPALRRAARAIGRIEEGKWDPQPAQRRRVPETHTKRTTGERSWSPPSSMRSGRFIRCERPELIMLATGGTGVLPEGELPPALEPSGAEKRAKWLARC